jgi:hypothetical protein
MSIECDFWRSEGQPSSKCQLPAETFHRPDQGPWMARCKKHHPLIVHGTDALEHITSDEYVVWKIHNS